MRLATEEDRDDIPFETDATVSPQNSGMEDGS
jgi:hypothetical protein